MTTTLMPPSALGGGREKDSHCCRQSLPTRRAVCNAWTVQVPVVAGAESRSSNLQSYSERVRPSCHLTDTETAGVIGALQVRISLLCAVRELQLKYL